jgi:hypothetical protein
MFRDVTLFRRSSVWCWETRDKGVRLLATYLTTASEKPAVI